MSNERFHQTEEMYIYVLNKTSRDHVLEGQWTHKLTPFSFKEEKLVKGQVFPVSSVLFINHDSSNTDS